MGILGAARAAVGRLGAGARAGLNYAVKHPGEAAKHLDKAASTFRTLSTAGGLIPNLTPRAVETFSITVYGSATANRADLFYIAYAIARGRSFRTRLNNLPANLLFQWAQDAQASLNWCVGMVKDYTYGLIDLNTFSNPLVILETLASAWEYTVHESLTEPQVTLEYSFSTNALYNPRLLYLGAGDLVTQAIAPSRSNILAGNFVPQASPNLKVWGYGQEGLSEANKTEWVKDFPLSGSLPNVSPQTDRVVPPRDGGTRGTSLEALFVAALQGPCETPPRPGTTGTTTVTTG